ncbi:hypothetical protein RAE03_07780 [Corynebacterium tuberculostearicum]|uniref:Uncharacterized protein n=1 Tax=Corynebacterium tuberculostearicum TaxID=38304 RepID=A0AAE4NMQ8_9CORY|nr:hypothetical protein [Corynebacterium tuberculostearicum]MDV2419670.1 hypothetical protein [Corynebacterium tuberculostearicum]
MGIDTKKQKKSTARIFVLFARKDDSYDESFAGVALTRNQEKAMGQCVDRPGVTCWTEETCLRGWKGPLDAEHHPEMVYMGNDQSPIFVKEWHIWKASFGRVLSGANGRGEVQVSMYGVRS